MLSGMRRLSIIAGVSLVATASVLAAFVWWPRPVPAHSAVLERYCVACHNDAERAGDLSLARLDHDDVASRSATWEAVVRKLRAGLMPPQGEPRPERAVLDALALSLENALDADWARAPNPGAKPLARLNRTEYANAVRDLLAFDAREIASKMPAQR
jgi:hypothetical protein